MNKLAELRKELGLSQIEAADYLKISRRGYQYYENNQSKMESTTYKLYCDCFEKLLLQKQNEECPWDVVEMEDSEAVVICYGDSNPHFLEKLQEKTKNLEGYYLTEGMSLNDIYASIDKAGVVFFVGMDKKNDQERSLNSLAKYASLKGKFVVGLANEKGKKNLEAIQTYLSTIQIYDSLGDGKVENEVSLMVHDNFFLYSIQSIVLPISCDSPIKLSLDDYKGITKNSKQSISFMFMDTLDSLLVKLSDLHRYVNVEKNLSKVQNACVCIFAKGTLPLAIVSQIIEKIKLSLPQLSIIFGMSEMPDYEDKIGVSLFLV